MKPQLRIPPPAEWDFRGIRDEALPIATLYEYARSSPKVCGAVSRWLDTSIDGHRVGDILGDAQMTNARRVQAARQKGIDMLRNEGLAYLVCRVGDLVKPWIGVSRTTRVIQTRSVSIFRAYDDLGIRSGSPDEDADGLCVTYALEIAWAGQTVEGVIDHFAAWARREARTYAHLMKPRGKASQVALEPLRQLAAYRLKAAGFSYRQTKTLLAVYRNPSDETRRRLTAAGIQASDCQGPPVAPLTRGKRELLPDYADASAFTRAAQAARQRLAELENAGKPPAWSQIRVY